MQYELYFVGWWRAPALGASVELPHTHAWGGTVWSVAVWVGPVTFKIGRW